MSKDHDDSTVATKQEKVSLSSEKLLKLQPELFTNGRYLCNPLCAKLHPVGELREQLEKQLESGASEPALAVSVEPLLIAAYSGDLDGVALLRSRRSWWTNTSLRSAAGC
jgi:hypothetical protein